MTIKTNTKYNFTEAENEIFAWESYRKSYLTHKPTGRQIYQMRWINKETGYTDQNVEGEIKEQAIAFLDEMWALRDQKPPRQMEFAEPEHGFGWCDKCESYCYGDCEANS